MARKRTSFTPEFKEQLVLLYREQRTRKTVSQVARENGVGAETLRNWGVPRTREVTLR
jgi:transposase-like protein